MRFVPGCNCCGDCGSIRVNVRTCSGATLISGVTVTVYDEDDNVVGTDTTGVGGQVEIAISAAATYRVHVFKSGTGESTRVVAATCSLNTVDFELGRSFLLTAMMCGPLAGAEIIITQTASGKVYRAISGADGTVVVHVSNLPPFTGGAYTYSATAPRRGVVATGSLTNNHCGQVSATASIDPATGYHCGRYCDSIYLDTPQECAFGVADTLHMTDSVYGPVTLTWTDPAPGAFSGDGPGWYGTNPGPGASPGQDDVVHYYMGSAFKIRFTGLDGVGSGPTYTPACDPVEQNLYCPPAYEQNWTLEYTLGSPWGVEVDPHFTVTE